MISVHNFKSFWLQLCVVGLVWLCVIGVADAASLSISPSTGVYQAGATFTAQVQVRPSGQSVNAAEGTIKFNPNELSVVSVNRSTSIFNLWVAEPAFSNTAGTITFSGGVPSGYNGNVGTVLSITFRARNAGSSRITFSDGSVLANDGRGTNVLTAMNGGTYTIQAAQTAPVPEVIEYVAPANTPAAPIIDSVTHPNPAGWYDSTEASLAWSLPADVVAVRTLLDGRSTTVPTRVYDTPINSITLDELTEGVSFFHLQFRNADGWGRITHYRLAIDTTAPSDVVISTASSSNPADPKQVLAISVSESGSGIERYLVKINNDDPITYDDLNDPSKITLPTLPPGYHSVIIEALDYAGNSTIGSYSFTIEAFDAPIFTDIPTQMSGDAIPVIRGTTRSDANVTIMFNRLGSEPNQYQVTSDSEGLFTFIPDGALIPGVYELTASAQDQFGAQSAVSALQRIVVQEPGYIRIGTQIVSIMSVIVPLFLLTVLLVLGVWYVIFLLKRFRKKVRIESTEALDILHREFSKLQEQLREQEVILQQSRKTNKLTKAESAMIELFDRSLQKSQRAVEKEIEDVTSLTKE